jgi:K+-sensing histidine kinase KdpD
MDQPVIDRTVALASPEHAKITVLGVARVYGTSLGFPNPGLQPNRLEIEELRQIVDGAAESLRREGFEVRTQVSKSRNAPKMIGRWVKARNFHAVVIPDPERPRWRRVIEGDLKRDIERRAGVPVYAVPVSAALGKRARSA